MPRLWNDTIEAHRREVRDAIMDTTAALVGERGLRSVTMSQIAERTGIGRATLYKYFSAVDAILVAWHDRHVTAHLEHLAAVRDQPGDPGKRLEAVLQAYANIAYWRSRQHDDHGAEIDALVHRDEHVMAAQQHLQDLIRDVLTEAAEAGEIRDDVPPDQLATYCRHALAAAGSAPSEPAIGQLVEVTLAGLRARR